MKQNLEVRNTSSDTEMLENGGVEVALAKIFAYFVTEAEKRGVESGSSEAQGIAREMTAAFISLQKDHLPNTNDKPDTTASNDE